MLHDPRRELLRLLAVPRQLEVLEVLVQALRRFSSPIRGSIHRSFSLEVDLLVHPALVVALEPFRRLQDQVWVD